MIDTHSHIFMLENPDKSMKESLNSLVECVVVPSAKQEDFASVLELTRKYNEVFGALGIHPEDISSFEKSNLGDIYNLAVQNKKIVAIGEIGLDYYWDKTQKEKQKDVFKLQLEVAMDLNLPVIVHDREAHSDVYELLKKYKIKRAILHCFSGSYDFAKSCIQEGWLLGIGGIVTFKNTKKIKEVVSKIPLEYLVLETDAPYLTPHPFRGEENSPKYLKFIAKEIANIKDTTFENVDIVTTQTAKEFFNIS